MGFFNMSLAPRLALAAISGALTFPANRLDTYLGSGAYPPLFSWWLILHGIFFGVLVMGPFVSGRRYRGLRVVALTVASVFSYDAAVRIPDILPNNQFTDTGDFMLSGLTGALLVATAVRFIAPLRVAAPYWAYSALAGLAGGLIFSQVFELCDWDHCRTAWLILPYTSGWVAWQSLVCAAMFLGLRQQAVDSGPLRPEYAIGSARRRTEAGGPFDEVPLHEIDTDFP